MGRQIIAEASLENYLKSLCKLQEIATGLIIGQVSKLLNFSVFFISLSKFYIFLTF